MTDLRALREAVTGYQIDKIREASSPMEATALAAQLQDSTLREFTDSVSDLKGSVRQLNSGTNCLLVLTAVLTVCTVVLVVLTWKLVLL